MPATGCSVNIPRFGGLGGFHATSPKGACRSEDNKEEPHRILFVECQAVTSIRPDTHVMDPQPLLVQDSASL